MGLQAYFARLGVLLVVGALGVLAFSASASAENMLTFVPSGGAQQEFEVPTGVTQIEVSAVGGAGQGASRRGCYGPGAGGSGALVTATLKVTAGERLGVNFGGGAPGASGCEGDSHGGSGGGRSELSEPLSGPPLVVAGGGGGGGGAGNGGAGGAGGNAEALVGENGGGGPGGEGGGLSGGKGGAGESGNGETCTSGGNGAILSGGEGGSGNSNCGGGGGGGGGYHGGGGGGGGIFAPGGGGAGSSYVIHEASEDSVTSGAGIEQEVVIAYGTLNPCAAGYFSATGSEPCNAAPLGAYASAGASHATPCSAGTYAATRGSAACTSASPGHFVPSTGQSSQDICGTGSYQPDPGQTACIQAAAGYYVSTEGSETQTRCTRGYTTNGTGSNSESACFFGACTNNTTTIKLPQGLSETPAVLTATIEGTLTGCTGVPAFTTVHYTATLKTAGPAQCHFVHEVEEEEGEVIEESNYWVIEGERDLSGPVTYTWEHETATGKLNIELPYETRDSEYFVGIFGEGLPFSSMIETGPYVSTISAGNIYGGLESACSSPGPFTGTFTGSDVTLTPPTASVSSVSPATGPVSGGKEITIEGSGFESGAEVEIAQAGSPIKATNVKVLSSTEIKALTGGGAETGTWDVSVINSGNIASAKNPPGDDFTYTQVPGVDTLPASEVTALSATLNAKVDPDGLELTECVIEYGTTTAYGTRVPCAPGTGELVSATVSGLVPGGYYHYRVVATNAAGPATGQDVEFRTLVIPGVDTLPASSVTTSTATLNAKVNPKGIALTGCVIEYGRTSAYGSSMPCSPAPESSGTGVLVSADVSGLAAGSYYHYRVVASNANGTAKGNDEEFRTLLVPGVDTLPASEVTATAATLNAKVNPKGIQVTGCVIEYGRTSAYGSSMPCSTEPGSAGTGVLVSVDVSGLAAGSYYHYRVVASNANGTAKGSDEEFRTLVVPGVETLPASEITSSSATLNAKVNPKGVQVTECVIEYGTSNAYGHSEPCSPEPGSGSTGVHVSAEVEGLAANKTYHYRVKASNANGTTNGLDQTFKT